ncbi:MAG: sodium:proton exchanger [Gemmatimonadota bacterium]|nr:sodium:proton exchanger [Gemmatimonadota bacterium]
MAPRLHQTPPTMLKRIVALAGARALVLASLALAATFTAGALRATGSSAVAVFCMTAIALASFAAVVGQATDHLRVRLGTGAAGVLQSALGNLPELFISIFALRAGLVVVVQTALIGSILANTLLILGLAFFIGGVRHGPQKFGATTSRMMAMLLVLSVASLAIPTFATAPRAPDFGHRVDLSIVTAIVLLVVFAGSLPMSIRGTLAPSCEQSERDEPVWPLGAAIALLLFAGVGAALVSDWFVEALRPTMASLRMSEEFVGLVIVAIAGNAVENVVGIAAAARNHAELAVSLILNSSLQIALLLIPVLVLVSALMSGPALTLVAPTLLVAALALTAVLVAMIIFDGESNYVEGLALIGLYVIIAASVWFGAPIAA